MKNLKHILIIICAVFGTSPLLAQIFGNDPEIKIDGLQPESVWQIAEMAMNDNQIPIGKLDITESVLISDWIEWTAVAIKNHAHLYFKYEDPILVVKIADRQYSSTEGWSEAIGNLSKKKYDQYVQSVADRISEISKDAGLMRTAVKTSKLIPAFNAINMVGDIEVKLLESAQTEENRPVFKFVVTNTGSKTVKLALIDADFHNQSGTGTARSGIFWEKPDESDNAVTTLQPGQITNLEVRIGQGYYLETAIGYAMMTKWEYNNQTEFLFKNIYNIPIPYTYQEGD